MVLLVDEEDRESMLIIRLSYDLLLLLEYESQLQTVYNVAVYSVQKSKPKVISTPCECCDVLNLFPLFLV